MPTYEVASMIRRALKLGLSAVMKTGSKVIQVCGGRAHTVILTDVGRVYTCGRAWRILLATSSNVL
jgi:alpha-tubulin suppressor-like RCC1 family protein